MHFERNEERANLYFALRILAQSQDVVQDTHGNVSVRVGDYSMWIKPSGVPYDKISEETLCAINFGPEVNGIWEQTRGNLKPSVDTIHHAWIYKNNPHVRAICHTHSPNVVAHAMRWEDIICATTEQADFFGADIYCVPYEDLYVWGSQLKNVGDQKAVLLANHGALTFADDPRKAVKLAIQLENIARKNVLAGALSSNVRLQPLKLKEAAKWHKRFQEDYGQKP